ncbi:hypothetical protein KKC32_04275 [Patescibacteria group bacterium]|nr:hypothetical protein [Patescibacteria group bacterium]
MKINLDKIYNILRVITICALIAVLAFLICRKIVPENSVSYSTDFSAPAKFIYGLYPQGRVSLVDVNGEIQQKIIGDPVYFQVYSPRKFSKAKVVLKFKKPKDLSVKMGVRLATGDWAYYLKDLDESAGQFVEQEFEFDLAKARLEKNKLQFMIASPDVIFSEEKIIIGKAEFTLMK